LSAIHKFYAPTATTRSWWELAAFAWIGFIGTGGYALAMLNWRRESLQNQKAMLDACIRKFGGRLVLVDAVGPLASTYMPRGN
jgi:hypothetical protein